MQLTYCPAGFFKGKSYLLLSFVLKEDPLVLQALPPWMWLPWKVLVFIVIFQEDTDQVRLVKLLRHTSNHRLNLDSDRAVPPSWGKLLFLSKNTDQSFLFPAAT